MLDHMEYSHSSGTQSSTTTPLPAAMAMRKKRSTKNIRRFSDEQINSLESLFRTESRLEPVKKMQLARELGLLPRQVAIWFQNKRARWKSKQLERDYTILRANYNSLASRFDALKREKQALLLQLQTLNDQIKKLALPEETRDHNGVNSTCSESENGGTGKGEAEAKPSPSTERSEHNMFVVVSDGDSSIRAEDEYFGLVNFVEHVAATDGSLTSTEGWSNFDSNDLLGPSNGDYQLWDFWS